MKKGVIFVAGLGIVLIAVLWILISHQEKNSQATPITKDIILFYGKECPHCQDVEKFIEENKIMEKVGFDSVEVWHNQANSEVMMEKAKECGLSQENLGVPFVWARGKCFMGGPESEKFFRQEAGM
jgi:glutaredoxin